MYIIFKKSIQLIDWTLTDTSSLSQSGPGSNDHEEVILPPSKL